MNKTLVSALAILATASAFAASTKFPDSDGSHDISSPAAWGGSIPAGGVKFATKNAVYNAQTGDVEFSDSVNAGGEKMTFDLSATPSRKIGTKGYFDFSVGSTTCGYKGGNWTAAKDFRIGTSVTGRSGLAVTFSAQAALDCRSVMIYGDNDSITFTDGATLNTPSGYSTKLPTSGTGNSIVFSDGVSCTMAEHFYLATSGNLLSIEDSSVTLGKTLEFNSDSSDNGVLVLDGASLTVPSVVLNGSENELVVSNSTLVCSGSSPIAFKGSGNRVILQGEDLSLELTPDDTIIANGRQNEFVIADGAKWSYRTEKKVYHLTKYAGNGCSNRVVVARQGEMDLTGTQFYIGSSNVLASSVCVVDGGTLKAYSLYLGGIGSALYITNGLVDVSSQVYGGKSSNDYAPANTNGLIEIVGAKAKVTSPSMFVKNGTTIRFVVPEDGYDGTPWVMSERPNIQKGCKFSVEADEFQAKLNESQDVVLMSWNNDNPWIDDSVLAAANAELEPKKMKLIFDKDNKQLVLRVRSLKPGLTIIFR